MAQDWFDQATAPAGQQRQPAVQAAPMLPGIQVKPRKQPDPLELENRQLRNQQLREDVLGPKDPPSGYQWTPENKLTPIPGGPADPAAKSAGDAKAQESERTAAFLATRLVGAFEDIGGVLRANPDAEGPAIGASIAGLFGPVARNYANSPARRQIEAAQMDALDAALTLGTGAAYTREQIEGYRQSYFPQLGDDTKTIAAKRLRFMRLIEAAKVKAGSSAPAIDRALANLLGGERQDRSAPLPNPSAPDQGTPTPTVGAQRFATPQDKKFAALAQAAFDAGRGRKYLDALAKKYGYAPYGPDLDAAMQWRAKNGKGAVIATPESGVTDPSAAEDALSAGAAGPVGAYFAGAANAIAPGAIDEIAGGIDALKSGRPLDEAIAEANLKKGIIRDANPGADLVGNISGGAVVGGLGAATAVRSGMTLAAPRVLSPAAIGVDAAYGASYGALEQNDDRLAGAGIGAVAGAGGGTLVRGVTKSVGRAISPNAGPAAPLYEAGVRPTPGQRFGGVVNATEEALGSLPVVGGAVRGARQKARDQFEAGAFNQALSEIGEKLPKGMKLGTDPHRFAQGRFNKAYNEARAGMRFVRDAAFDEGYTELVQSISDGGLSPESARRFQTIVRSQIDRRLKGGSMNGEAYKAAQAEIGGIVRGLRNSPSGDHELATALEQFGGLLDQGARRSSSPEAVAALDAADRGYSMLVRIEEAAKGAGDPGRFTPNQFDRAVQNAQGGKAARSKAYLRGDALMQDYGAAGRMLSDKVPNSGTPERQMLTAALMGATGGLISPSAAAAPLVATLPYMPGAREAVSALITPRKTPALIKTGNAIVKSARPAGTSGSAAAAALLPRD